MLRGTTFTLRPITEEDLPQLYAYEIDLENRGDFYGRTFHTMSEMRRELAQSGYWNPDFGILLIVDNKSQSPIGRLAWYRTVQYMDEIEIGYIMFDVDKRSKGRMTEALKLFTNYLFDTRPMNRIRLCIAPMNTASRRVAEKAGYLHEATQRGVTFRNGRVRDVELYAILRNDPRV